MKLCFTSCILVPGRTAIAPRLQITSFLTLRKEQGEAWSLGFHARGDSSSFRKRCFRTGSQAAPQRHLPPSLHSHLLACLPPPRSRPSFLLHPILILSSLFPLPSFFPPSFPSSSPSPFFLDLSTVSCTFPKREASLPPGDSLRYQDVSGLDPAVPWKVVGSGGQAGQREERGIEQPGFLRSG